MSKKYSQVRVENPAATLTGAEIFVVTQDGESVGTTVQEIADFTGGGGGIDIVSTSTAGATITFNFDSEEEAIFVGSASFSTAKDIVFSNDTIAKKLSFSLNITDVAAILTFPSSVIMSDVRWEVTGAKEWQPDGVGVFKGTAFFDGTNWIMDISSAPYA